MKRLDGGFHSPIHSLGIGLLHGSGQWHPRCCWAGPALFFFFFSPGIGSNPVFGSQVFMMEVFKHRGGAEDVPLAVFSEEKKKKKSGGTRQGGGLKRACALHTSRQHLGKVFDVEQSLCISLV